MDRRKSLIIVYGHVVAVMITVAAMEHHGSTILYSTVGRSHYAFDIFSVDLPSVTGEIRLTDGKSINYNGQFPSPASARFLAPHSDQSLLLYVSERDGSFGIYLDGFGEAHSRSALEESPRRRPILPESDKAAMKDRPSLVGGRLVYVSTHEDPGEQRKSWAAVYASDLQTGEKVRLTPPGVADFSPAVSPSGRLTAVASTGERGWAGEIEDLQTGIYIFRTVDGSGRRRVVEHGGWPCWADESTLYFHRRSGDGWWSIYKTSLQADDGQIDVERVTPPGVHAFTPAASPGSAFLCVATRRPGSAFRQIELFDTERKVFVEITQRISPSSHHYNPFVSPDGTRLGYHRCRGASEKREKNVLWLENRRSPLSDISLLRIDGSFPSFSPDGELIAYVGLPGLFVASRDGTGRSQILTGTAFGTAWNPKRKGLIYTSTGPIFAGELTEVDVVSVQLQANMSNTITKLTIGGKNNAFPSPSPDGTRLVFRSGRSGHKNLYIMDAVRGESAGLVRLTEGNWTDTMCNWSPDGTWIAFSSDRHRPGSGGFALYFIRPDGTGLRKVFETGPLGRVNHAWFSPDSTRVVFSSDHAAVSAEPIGNPHQFQPYGDIFVADVAGSGVVRLTHSAYEDGTPTWSPATLPPTDVSGCRIMVLCRFDDCHFLSQPGAAAAVLKP